ncbi:hypothetical protein MMC30_006629 [Trapelia coarctata]|nr:hypothetical protein [Trapelia coarctata]
MSSQWLRTPSSQDLCIFCASRLYFSPPPSVVPSAHPLYTQRRAIQSSTRVRKPVAAAAALQDEGEQEGIVSRPSYTPLNSTLRSTSSTSPGLPPSSRTLASPAIPPAKLSWDAWSTALEAESKAQVRSGVPLSQKLFTERKNLESGNLNAIASTSKDKATAIGIFLTHQNTTKVGSGHDMGGWARYSAPKTPIPDGEQSEEKQMGLGQELVHGTGSKGKKSIGRGAGRWRCTCGASVYSRAPRCHYCRRSRDECEATASHNHQQGNAEPGRTSADVEETNITAATHWRHVRRRAGSAGIGEISDGKVDGTADQDNPAEDNTADRVAQEREERLRASANGGYVGFKEVQGVNGNIETRGTATPIVPGPQINILRRGRIQLGQVAQDGPAQKGSSVVRKTVSAQEPAFGEVYRKELPSQPKEFVTANMHAKTPSAQESAFGEVSAKELPSQPKEFVTANMHMKTPSAQESAFGELSAKELHSQPKEFVTAKIRASTPSSDSWKAWKPPAQQPGDSATQPLETEDGPAFRYSGAGPAIKKLDVPIIRLRKMNGLRLRRAVVDDSSRQTVWNSADPSPLEQGTPVSQASRNEETPDGFTEHRSAKRVPSGAIARNMFRLDTSADRSRVADRNRSRRRQQRAADFDDEDETVLARIERKRQRKKEKTFQSSMGPPTPIILPEYISVGNLATVLRVRIEDFVRRMESLGFEETNNDHVLDAETAGLIAAEFNFEPVTDRGSEVEDLVALSPPDDKSYLLQRPPVITIMGHVDHGKTTLLDYLRKSSVAASEHGGITQHIGAFTVPMPSGQIVTFLDTPGHAAFLSMRQRGANVTDIVILVVAADDSVKPQTIEAINHAKAANVPMIVAINKIDKPDADVTRVKQDLARHGVEVEDFGGDTQVVCVSGKTGQGMEELEDAAVALADVLDLRAETDGQAEGWILEATTKKSGRVATVLVRRGTVVPGSVIVAGTTWARVRNLRNEAGQTIPSAGPGTPAEVDGWREQPEAGDEVIQAPNEQRAKDVVELRVSHKEKEKLAADVAAVNEARRLEQEKREREEAAAKAAKSGEPEPVVPEEIAAARVTEIPFIVRGDVSGSVEAVVDSISSLGNSEVRPTILRSAVGPIAPTDVEHAAAAKGHIITFNTPVEGSIRRMAEAAGVSILDQSIIYRLVDDVNAKLESVLPEVVTTRVTGEAEVAQVFEINVKGRVTVPVAGCRVRNGVIGRTSKVRVMRGGEVVYDGTLSSLKNQKKDVTEMRKGAECGMGFEGFTDFQVGDQVQCYEEKSEKRKL